MERGNPLFPALLALASGAGSMQERLRQAYDAGLAPLFSTAQIPEPVRQEVLELKAQFWRALEHVPAMRDQMDTALLRLDNATAQQLAQQVVYLYRVWAASGESNNTET